MSGRNAYGDAEPVYLSYLLRLWCDKGEEGTVWRASLRSTLTRQQVGFAGLEALFEYLRAQTSAVAEQDFGNLPRFPQSMDQEGKGGDDANSVDPKAADL